LVLANQERSKKLEAGGKKPFFQSWQHDDWLVLTRKSLRVGTMSKSLHKKDTADNEETLQQ
jgi:hypothetical protein